MHVARWGLLALAVRTGAAMLALSPITVAHASPASASPALSWGDCGGGFQCATAPVPLDCQQDHRPFD